MASLSQFLQKAAETPFAWGAHDCLLMVADRVRDVHGFDPAERWRGHYHTIWQARSLLIKNGGHVGLIEAAFAGRLPRTDAPKAGDVGVILADTDRGIDAVGAVRTGMGWAVLTQSGLHIVSPAKPLMSWSV